MCHRDNDGWYYFDFRKGGGLRRQGDFIQPEYVEKALADMDEVTDVCVYGIPAASGAPGESDIVAAIVLSDGQKIDPARVFAALSSTLEKHAVPSYLQIVDEIPKSASEKNLDRFLRDDFSPDSDVDLLVKFHSDMQVGFLTLSRMQRELSDLFRCKVDLLPQDGLKPPIRGSILRDAEVLYAE